MGDKPPEKRSQSSQLVDMARERYSLGVSDDGQPYGSYPDAPHVALPLRGGKLGLRASLARNYFEKHKTVPSSQALADACTVLEGYAMQETPHPLHLRVAEHAGHIYIDTADKSDRVIVIGDGEWRVSDTAPVVFRRTELTAPIQAPARGGNVEKLWEHINVVEADRAVLLAVMVSAWIQPEAPHVILGLLAEHGSAKSTTTRRIVALIDPTIAPLRMPARDIEQWVTAANGSWVVAIDNVSTIPQWWSDALCRAATGDALTKRRLYTDADLAVLKFRRCCILNGIDLGGLAGDFSDRLALADLTRITHRRDEAQLEAEWRRDYPAILGGLLDLAAEAHAMLPTVTVAGGLSRMADFTKTLACIDAIRGSNGLDRYRERASHLAADSLASDSLIAELVAQRHESEERTARQILEHLTPTEKDWRRPRDWPRNARIVTTQLTRHAPALRARGWTIENDHGRNRDKVTRWTIMPPRDEPEFDPHDPQYPQPQVNGHEYRGSECGSSAGQKPDAGQSAGHAGQPETPNPQTTACLTSDYGSAGHAGQENGQSLDGHLFTAPATDAGTPTCDCGNSLITPDARAAGKCKPCRDRERVW